MSIKIFLLILGFMLIRIVEAMGKIILEIPLAVSLFVDGLLYTKKKKKKKSILRWDIRKWDFIEWMLDLENYFDYREIHEEQKWDLYQIN